MPPATDRSCISRIGGIGVRVITAPALRSGDQEIYALLVTSKRCGSR
jgi:hypothetical protein